MLKPKFNFLNYIKKIIQSDSNASSKRFLALYTTLILITFVVVSYTNKNNNTIVLTTLCSFVFGLVGVAVWQDVKNKQNK